MSSPRLNALQPHRTAGRSSSEGRLRVLLARRAILLPLGLSDHRGRCESLGSGQAIAFEACVVPKLAALQLRSEDLIVDMGPARGVGAVVTPHACPERADHEDRHNPAAFDATRGQCPGKPRLAAKAVSAEIWRDHVIDRVLLANPTISSEPGGPRVRTGAACHGGAVALGHGRMALARLAPAGRSFSTPADAIIDGRRPVAECVRELELGTGCRLRYRELDPDVFGEELAHPG